MASTSKLTLEATGQYLSMPLVGAHDNAAPVGPALDKCIAQLARVAGK